MPNPSNAQEQVHLNGHHLEGHHQNGHYQTGKNQTGKNQTGKNQLAEPSISNSESSVPLAPAELPASRGDDWSFVTKDLVDVLPRVWTRGLLYFLVTFAVIVLPWAAFSKVDETGNARGRLEPKGRTLKLDAPVAGTVVAVKVKEGERVTAGQVLLELESELAQTELQQAQAKLEGQLDRVTQFEVIRNQLEIAIRAQRLQSQAQQSAQLTQLDQTQQRLNANSRAYTLAKNRLAKEQIEVQRYRQLLQEGVIAPVKQAEVERLQDESQQLLNQVQADMEQAAYEIKKQQSNYEDISRTGELSVLESELRLKEIQSQIADTQAEIIQTQKQIEALQFQLQQRILRAPTNGTVFQLAVQNPGSVLQAGQAIAQVAPESAKLIFRAEMPSQESGFLHVGAPVKLKFDAYPFQDYGVVPGHLRWISPDSKIVETAQGRVETFELEIVLDQSYIQNQDKRVVLTPGQTAIAEVIIRQRHVIDFILDPFKKLQKGGLEL
ncbi:MAG: HlyD family efflux transporter periplasmic adaptor subunit [Leptolyngbyaceae cyanobacterium CRU_2_3]|nr:HlyD family efflux transporter periplasmic adaptor subunit [Leptolyngbyaceae cyanobacterium CRU_2_3]